MFPTPAVLLLLAAVLGPVPTGPAPQRSHPWNFSIAGGLGVREVGAEGFGVPYIGFWAAQARGETLDLVYEGFTLAPSTIRDHTLVRDVAFGFLLRVNHYFRQGAVRPYATIGAGLVLRRRVREGSGAARTRSVLARPSRSDTEVRLGVNSVVGFGVRIRVRDGWDLRPEARIPFPFLPPVGGHPLDTVAVAIGATYTPGGD